MVRRGKGKGKGNAEEEEEGASKGRRKRKAQRSSEANIEEEEDTESSDSDLEIELLEEEELQFSMRDFAGWTNKQEREEFGPAEPMPEKEAYKNIYDVLPYKFSFKTVPDTLDHTDQLAGDLYQRALPWRWAINVTVLEDKRARAKIQESGSQLTDTGGGPTGN